MRALVAFGTRYGSTEDVADTIASGLRGKGWEVDVADLRIDWDGALEDYGLVVLGSAIVAGSWSRGAKSFLSRNSDALSDIPVAMFVCCGDVLLAPERLAESRVEYLDDVAAAHGIEPESKGLFGGVLDLNGYGFLVRTMLKRMGARDRIEGRGMDPDRPFDFRDWDEIGEWISELPDPVTTLTYVP